MHESLTVAARRHSPARLIRRIHYRGCRAGSAPLPHDNVRVVDGFGATLMPRMTEIHSPKLAKFGGALRSRHACRRICCSTARNARILLDHGFTSAYSAGALGKTLEVSLKSQIDSGGMPGRGSCHLGRARAAQRNGLLARRKRGEHGRSDAVRALSRIARPAVPDRQISAVGRKCAEAGRFTAASVHRRDSRGGRQARESRFG